MAGGGENQPTMEPGLEKTDLQIFMLSVWTNYHRALASLCGILSNLGKALHIMSLLYSSPSGAQALKEALPSHLPARSLFSRVVQSPAPPGRLHLFLSLAFILVHGVCEVNLYCQLD